MELQQKLDSAELRGALDNALGLDRRETNLADVKDTDLDRDIFKTIELDNQRIDEENGDLILDIGAELGDDFLNEEYLKVGSQPSFMESNFNEMVGGQVE